MSCSISHTVSILHSSCKRTTLPSETAHDSSCAHMDCAPATSGTIWPGPTRCGPSNSRRQVRRLECHQPPAAQCAQMLLSSGSSCTLATHQLVLTGYARDTDRDMLSAAYKEEDVALLKQKGPTGCRDWWCLQVRCAPADMSTCDRRHNRGGTCPPPCQLPGRCICQAAVCGLAVDGHMHCSTRCLGKISCPSLTSLMVLLQNFLQQQVRRLICALLPACTVQALTLIPSRTSAHSRRRPRQGHL